jgi:hypothetical protein
MKVIKLCSFQGWEGKDGKKMRTVEMELQVGEEAKQVKFYQLESDPLPKADDEYGDEWELKGKADNNGNPFIVLSKKKTEKNSKPYQKYPQKEVSPRSYLINTCLPSVFPAVLGGAYTVKQVTDVLEEFILWAEADKK